MKLFVIGNCQKNPITSILRSNEIDVEMTKKPIHLINFEDIKNIKKQIKKSDIIILQYSKGQRYIDLELDPASIKRLHSNVILIPNVYCIDYHPTFTSISQGDLLNNKLQELISKNCFGPDFDCLALYAYDKNISLTDLINFLGSKNSQLNINLKDSSNNNLQNRERGCDITISDYIETSQKTRTLFYSLNHPVNIVFQELCQRIVNKIGIKKTITSRIMPYLSNYRLPIYPVITSLWGRKTHDEWSFGGGVDDHKMNISVDPYDHLAYTIDWISNLNDAESHVLNTFRKKPAYLRSHSLLEHITK